jgi:hypothetical protein
LPEPLSVEMMLTPGAVMSGLRPLSPVRGPPDEKEAKPVKFALGRFVSVRLAVVPAGDARSRNESVPAVAQLPATPTKGMVTTYGIPVSGLEVILPSNGGSPAALLPMITAAAPAC